MKLTEKDVTHVANLARLTLTKEELIIFSEQLSEVVSYVSELNKVDTKSVEPTSQTTKLVNVFRNDLEVDTGLTGDEVLSGTDKTHNGYFVVPQIVSKEG